MLANQVMAQSMAGQYSQQGVCGRTCPNSRPHRTGLRPRFPTLFITPAGRETWGQPQWPYARAANFTSRRITQINIAVSDPTLTLIKLCLPEACQRSRLISQRKLKC